jgi:hypothetical protein
MKVDDETYKNVFMHDRPNNSDKFNYTNLGNDCYLRTPTFTGKLERGKNYKHRSGVVGVYSHSDEQNYNHFFKVIRRKGKWKLDELGMISLPTWDLKRNVIKL